MIWLNTQYLYKKMISNRCLWNGQCEQHHFLLLDTYFSEATRVRPQPLKLVIFSRFSVLKVAQWLLIVWPITYGCVEYNKFQRSTEFWCIASFNSFCYVYYNGKTSFFFNLYYYCWLVKEGWALKVTYTYKPLIYL